MEIEFGRVVDSLPGLVWTALPDGQIDFINQRWCAYTGLAADEARDKGWPAAIHPEDLTGLLARWRSVLASGQPGDAEARLRRADGDYRWFALRLAPLPGPDGMAVLWCGMGSDIDDRVRAEENLRANERRFQLIVDGLPGVVALFTAQGQLEFANRRMQEYLDQTFEQLRSGPPGYTFHPDDREKVLARWSSSVQTGDTYDYEARLLRADGVYRWCRMHGFPLREADGRIVLWYSLYTDVDDARRAEAMLAGEKRLLEMIARGLPLCAVLDALCGLVEETASACHCSILLLDSSGTRFLHGAAPSIASSYNSVFDGKRVDPNYGPCSLAATRKTQVLTTDVAADPRWQASAWPALALEHNLRSCWSTPILSADGGVLGVFALYHREPNSPTPLQQDLIAQFTQIASIAIERAQNDAALRQSEARKSAIMDSSLDCIVTIDHEGCIAEFNPAAERTFLYRREDVVGKPLADVIVPPSLRDGHRQGFARYLETGRTAVIGKRVEMTAIRADGSEFPVELAITRIPLDGPPSFTGYLRDITDRNRSEQELRRSEAFLSEAQHLSSTGSFSWRIATDEITWSKEVYRMFGLEQSEPVTLERMASRIHPDDMAILSDMVDKARKGLDFEYEHRLRMPDGSTKYLHMIAHGRRDRNEQLEFIGAVQDVTEQRLSELALGKVRSELSRVTRITSLGALTASIAHEVNQPLSGIITNASTCLRMLAADPPNVDGARETARRTIRDGNRAADVITRLRALFSNRGTTAESVDLNEATREVIALSASDLQRNQVNMKTDLAGDLPAIIGDRVQLQQVILNLLRNAMDAMTGIDDRARHLTIKTAREPDDQVRLTVQDSGEGLDAQNMDRLFEAFYTTKSDGMGMGLSISRSIIESHRGRLWAVPNDGPGAAFSFSIPSNPDAMPGDGRRDTTWVRPVNTTQHNMRNL